MFTVREEAPSDLSEIREVNRAAYGTDYEANRTDRLRSSGDVTVSLVAVTNRTVVGHILLSALTIETIKGTLQAASLTSLAVSSDWRRKGIGTKLVEKGLGLCLAQGKVAVFVLGSPEYYRRFGFSANLAKTLKSPENLGVGGAWMAKELEPGALGGVTGTIHYPAAFSQQG